MGYVEIDKPENCQLCPMARITRYWIYCKVAKTERAMVHKEFADTIPAYCPIKEKEVKVAN